MELYIQSTKTLIAAQTGIVSPTNSVISTGTSLQSGENENEELLIPDKQPSTETNFGLNQIKYMIEVLYLVNCEHVVISDQPEF